MSPVTSLS